MSAHHQTGHAAWSPDYLTPPSLARLCVPMPPVKPPRDPSQPKPCPFCGSSRIVKGERYFAMCVDCGATGPERSADATARKFFGDWNTRAPIAQD